MAGIESENLEASIQGAPFVLFQLYDLLTAETQNGVAPASLRRLTDELQQIHEAYASTTPKARVGTVLPAGVMTGLVYLAQDNLIALPKNMCEITDEMVIEQPDNHVVRVQTFERHKIGEYNPKGETLRKKISALYALGFVLNRDLNQLLIAAPSEEQIEKMTGILGKTNLAALPRDGSVEVFAWDQNDHSIAWSKVSENFTIPADETYAIKVLPLVTFSIRQVADLMERHPQTLRSYERDPYRWIEPVRSPVNNQRVYSKRDYERLKVIVTLKDRNRPREEIAEALKSL